MEPTKTRIGDLFIRLQMLDARRLEACLEHQEELAAKGRRAPLGDVAVQLGFLRPEQVKRALAHGGTAILKCAKCERRYTVKGYQALRRYKCGICKEYLQFSMDDNLDAREFEDETMTQAPAAAPAEAAAAPAAPAREAEADERRFGDYRLVQGLGRGAMGEVYLAEHVDTGEKVAVKVLAQTLCSNAQISKRFQREAEAAGRLDHPGIVKILDSGKERGRLYLVTEYVEGKSLEQYMLDEGKQDPERAVEITLQVLSALQHAHEKGIVHRDVKPGNILMTGDGRARLIDFGLARDAEAQTVLTLAGTVMGTPSYMSPEQVKGQQAGPAADLYACGVMLFFMLTGRLPYQGKSAMDTMEKQVTLPPPPIRQQHPEVPVYLEKVVHGLMAKNPEERLRPVGRVIEMLETKAATRAPAGAPAGGSSSWFLWLVIFALFAVAGLIAYLMLKDEIGLLK